MSKGFITFFINFPTGSDNNQIREMFKVIREENKDIIDSMKAAGYDSLFVPTMNEACRVEKTDYESQSKRENADLLEAIKERGTK